MWTTISVLLLAAAPPLDVRPALHDTSSRAPDTRPPLIAVGRVKREDSKLSAERSIKIAVQRAKNAKRAVVDAARAAERAKESLSKARKKARERHEELDILRERHHRHYDEPEEKQAWRREVRMSRTATLIMLFCFTFLNGVARRSLSSSGPSMVSEGLLTERRADEIFMVGFEAFAVGKLLVVPQTILLGVRHSLLLQLLVMAGCCFSYLVRPTSSAVHSAGRLPHLLDGRQHNAPVCWRVVPAAVVRPRVCGALHRLPIGLSIRLVLLAAFAVC